MLAAEDIIFLQNIKRLNDNAVPSDPVKRRSESVLQDAFFRVTAVGSDAECQRPKIVDVWP